LVIGLGKGPLACLGRGAAGVEHTRLLLALIVWGEGRHKPLLLGTGTPPGLFIEGVENLPPATDWDKLLACLAIPGL